MRAVQCDGVGSEQGGVFGRFLSIAVAEQVEGVGDADGKGDRGVWADECFVNGGTLFG